MLVLAQETAAKPTEISPPWLMHSSNFLITLFHVKGEDAQKLLPVGVTAKVNKSGMVIAGLEMYATDRAYGVPNYATVIVFVEITGHDSSNGMPGHWALWGKVNNPTALASFRHNFGLPYEPETNLSVDFADGVHVGLVGAPSEESIKIKITPQAEPPMNIEGCVNMVGKNSAGAIVQSEVPWFSAWQKGSLLSLDITPRGNPALELIKSAQPFFVMTSGNQMFSYSKAVQ